MQLPELSQIPNSDSRLLGMADCRGEPTIVIDLNKSLGKDIVLSDSLAEAHAVVTEFNNKVQAFLVDKVEKIVRKDWSDVNEPPFGDTTGGYLTAVTKIDGKLVQILDVEKILEDISGGASNNLPRQNRTLVNGHMASEFTIMIVDDSAMARNKTENILSSLGVKTLVCKNGVEAYDKLLELAEASEARGLRIEDELVMVLSDIEMPQMDGLALVQKMRENMSLKNLHVVIQSSISGGFKNTIKDNGNVSKTLVKWDEQALISTVMHTLELKCEK